MVVGSLGTRSKMGGFGWLEDCAKACNQGSLGMLVWVIVLDWVRVLDFAY